MSHCPHCQSPVMPDARFCPSCREPLNTAAETCLNCNEPIKTTDAFCTKCGQAKEAPCPSCGSGIDPKATICPECGFDVKEGTSQKYTADDKQKAKEVLALLDAPVGLGKFKKAYSYLAKGDMDPQYVRVIEQAMMKGKSQKIVSLQLASCPRQWALLKVSLLRRFMTLLIDGPAVLGLFLGGLVLLIGSAKEPGVLDLSQNARGGVALGWFLVSYYAYFVLTEKILGATIGGVVCGIRVVNKFGERQSLGALIKRNTYKLVPLLGPYIFAPFVKPDHEIVKA